MNAGSLEYRASVRYSTPLKFSQGPGGTSSNRRYVVLLQGSWERIDRPWATNIAQGYAGGLTQHPESGVTDGGIFRERAATIPGVVINHYRPRPK
jgi:hypothetical protein